MIIFFSLQKVKFLRNCEENSKIPIIDKRKCSSFVRLKQKNDTFKPVVPKTTSTVIIRSKMNSLFCEEVSSPNFKEERPIIDLSPINTIFFPSKENTFIRQGMPKKTAEVTMSSPCKFFSFPPFQKI